MFAGYINGLWWDEPRLALSTLVDGTAYRPFVTRALLPLLVKMAESILPLSQRAWASVFMYLSLIGFVVSLRCLASALWKPGPFIDFISVSSLLGLFPLMLSNRHVYDLTTLFLFALELTFLARAKWLPYCLIYPVACLNKETTLLLTFVFCAFYFKRKTPRGLTGVLLWQVAAYLIIRLGLAWHYRGNPGAFVEYHLPEHLLVFFVAPAISFAYLLFGIVVTALVIRDFPEKPAFLRLAAAAIVPPLFILDLLFGSPLEMRHFYEAYPVMFLLCAPTLASLLPIRGRPIPIVPASA